MSVNIPPCPDSLKPIQQFLKTAIEHDARDPVVSYWCRLHALQVGLKLTSKMPEETALLLVLMDWLETTKKANTENEAITNEVAAQAHLENYALKLFLYADKQDRAANFGKNVVKAFYTAGVIFDVLTEFGELTEEVTQNRKYAKWKAAYIHTCLKNGETPVPGPMTSEDDENILNEPGPSATPIMGFSNSGGSQDPPENAGFTLHVPSGQDESPITNEGLHHNVLNLPMPPKTPQDENIGGFTAFEAPAAPEFGHVDTNVNLTPDQITKAQKYCKWAASALSYDDVKTAVTNLQKALTLLQTGSDPV